MQIPPRLGGDGARGAGHRWKRGMETRVPREFSRDRSELAMLSTVINPRGARNAFAVRSTSRRVATQHAGLFSSFVVGWNRMEDGIEYPGRFG